MSELLDYIKAFKLCDRIYETKVILEQLNPSNEDEKLALFTVQNMLEDYATNNYQFIGAFQAKIDCCLRDKKKN